MKKNWKQRLRRGSLAVEASILVPFLIFIVFAFLCLCLYLHDRSVLVACAAELAGKGVAQKYQSEEALEEWLNAQARGLAEGRLLAVREFEVSVKVTAQKVVVGYRGSTPLLGGLELQEEAYAKRLNPVTFIRGGRQLGGLIQE